MSSNVNITFGKYSTKYKIIHTMVYELIRKVALREVRGYIALIARKHKVSPRKLIYRKELSMANIDITTGLNIKADINKLYGDTAGMLAKFKENRTFNKDTYEELLGKYGELVAEIENIRNQVNDLLDQAQSNKMPDEGDIKAIDSIAGLIGAKNEDGTLNFQKLIEFSDTFGQSGSK